MCWAQQEIQNWWPAWPASSPSEQTDRQTQGRGAGDDSGLGGCQAMRWQRLALITGWLEGGWWWAPGTGRVHGVALGGVAWKALHIGGLITWHLLSSDDGSLALQPLTGMTFMPIPREEVFLLLRAQQSALTCSFSKWLQDSQLSECPSLLMDVNVILLAEHRAPQSVGNPGGCSP